MLLDNGQLRMMDFGIARISRAENQLLSGKTMGSVHYISPEQAKGDETDFTSDLYSVGVMMYEMLSGICPSMPMTWWRWPSSRSRISPGA